MSGQGTRYRQAGFTEPKPAIPVNGRPMIARLLDVMPREWPAHFVMATNHLETGLPELLRALRPGARIASVTPNTLGPLAAIRRGLEEIPPSDPVLVSYCDYGMRWDPVAFEQFVRSSECDACVVSYRGFHAHYLTPTPYAYSRLEGERVRQVREKGSFTADRENEYASCGAYYFRTAAILRAALEEQERRELKVNGEFYTSLTVEALLQANPDADVRVFEIEGFFQWGTPADLRAFEFWERSYLSHARMAAQSKQVAQVLMPMAGLGSRFKGISSQPKPLIRIGTEPMFRMALSTLPSADTTVLVALESFADAVAGEVTDRKSHVIRLPRTPEGQALSTAAGLDALQPDADVIVSSCDHGIVLDADAWNRFRSAADADAAIFTVQGFPGADRTPASFAYVVPNAADRTEFPVVQRVSVKQAVSPTPSRDHLLVGTFWFANPGIVRLAIDELLRRDIRVNNELYLDSALQCLVDLGRRVRMIPMSGYLNWGDPDSLAEALYWSEIYMGRRLSRRPRFPEVS